MSAGRRIKNARCSAIVKNWGPQILNRVEALVEITKTASSTKVLVKKTSACIIKRAA